MQIDPVGDVHDDTEWAREGESKIKIASNNREQKSIRRAYIIPYADIIK